MVGETKSHYKVLEEIGQRGISEYSHWLAVIVGSVVSFLRRHSDCPGIQLK
jgi:hypothetical protein